MTRDSSAEAIDSVREHAAELFERGVPGRSIERFLVDESTEPSLANELVSQLTTYHKRLCAGELGATEFLRWFIRHPFRSGWLGWSWLLALVAAILGGSIFLGMFAGGVFGVAVAIILRVAFWLRMVKAYHCPPTK